jgi:hypothetical protein
MNKLKSDYKNQISTLKENGETRNAGRVRKIKKLEEKITSLERDYHAGEKNLEVIHLSLQLDKTNDYESPY